MANISNQGTRRSVQAILAVGDNLISREASLWLDSTYFVVGANGQKELYPGLILAKDTVNDKYVPYNVSASYGVGSDTAVGILDTFVDVTWGDQAVAPVFHGKAIERHCYVHALAIGTIAADIKTDLADIKWV